ncbi:hypothetical protein GGI12_003239 [Dipsacomyces acuminosporus]|nr:hypothetical protein GGI12_003239 [Dipsacomyces acuminosporus]
MWEHNPRYDNHHNAGGSRDPGLDIGYGDYDSFDEMGDINMAGEHAPAHTYGGIRQMEQTSATSARERVSGSSVNPYATLHYINRELMELGLPSPLLLPELPEFLEDNQRIVECLLALLEQRKRDVNFRENMDDELRKAMGEEDILRSTINRLERELDASQREAAMTRIKWQESERQNAELESQKKKLAADLRTIRSNASMVKAQFMHESKKHEQESIKLKERLQKLITDKHRGAKISVELINPVIRDRSGRPVDNSSRDQKLLEELIGKYEANEVQLIAKVGGLEDTLRRLAASLANLHTDAISGSGSSEKDAGAVNANGDRTSPTTADKARADVQDGLVDITSALSMIESIRHTMDEARNQKVATIDQSEIDTREQQIAELKDEVARLQKEIEDLRKILAEQKRVMDMVSTKGFAKTNTEFNALEASFSEMSMEQLEIERDALRREKDQLEEERRRFTEAAIELGNERSELKKEREEFDKQKAAKGTEELMAGLPPTPQWMKGIDTSLATPMILHQLQAIYQGTPTNELLASMANGSKEEASGHDSRQQRSLEEEFPEIDDAYSSQMYHDYDNDDGADTHENSRQAKHSPGRRGITPSTSRASTGSQAHVHRSTTPSRPAPTRTPIEIRSGRQPRVCTRPGCAAHAPHTHEDGPNGPRMELKPPVPRFRKKADADGTPTSVGKSGALPQADRSRRLSAAGTRPSSTLPSRTTPAARNSTSTLARSPSRRAGASSSSATATATAAAQPRASSSATSRTLAANIFK